MDSSPGWSVARQVVQRARTDPDRIAVEHEGTRITFEQLVARALAVCADLQRQGVVLGDRVALLLERSPDLVVSALGCLLTGATYMGLDVREPHARLSSMLTDAGNPVVISDRMHPDDLPAGCTILRPAGTALAEPVADLHDDLPCYVTYTSGSTGIPKGVQVTHRGVSNLVRWYGEHFAVSPQDRMPQLARPSFDGWSLEVWPCLARGATLCIPSDSVLRSADDLARWLAKERITLAFVTTALGQELFAQPWAAALKPSLRALLIGGEKLPALPPAGLPFEVHNFIKRHVK